MKVHILTSRKEDIAELKQLLQSTQWQLTDAENQAAILLLDRDATPSWQATMRRLAETCPCVILLSNVTDQYLWDETVHNGGFEILTRPFKRDKILSTLSFAHTHNRAPWPRVIS